MYPCDLKLLTLLCVLLPSVVLARHGGGNSLSGLSLEPINAAIFAFCVIFAVLTALQAIQAANNIRRRIVQQPNSITSPEFTVGPIFPTFLLLSTLMFTTAYALHGAYWGLEYNRNTTGYPEFTDAYYGAWNAMEFLAEIFLASGILALISRREEALGRTSKVLRDIKINVDAILTVILLGLSMSYVAFSLAPVTAVETRTLDNLYNAYISFFLITAVNIAISSVAFYVHSRHNQTNDHKVCALQILVLQRFHLLFLRRLLDALHSSFLPSSSSIHCTLL